jgi:hypothetical protein
MDAARSDLAAIRRAVDAARSSLADGSRDNSEAVAADPAALAAAVARLLDAVEGMADLLDATLGEPDVPTNIGVVDANMPVAGPKFDRSRPRRGYGRGE